MSNSNFIRNGNTVEPGSTRAKRRLSKRLSPEPRPQVNDGPAVEDSARQQLLEQNELLERQLAEKVEQLAVVRKDLEKVSSEFQLFANATSHDLQTPLRAISGFSGFLHEEYQDQLDETAQSYIDRVVNGADRIRHLLNGLLVYSRVMSRGAPFALVNLNDIVENVIGSQQDRMNEIGAAITCGPLPAVYGDVAQLTVLIQNLVDNSLKFRSDSQPVIHISAERIEDEWTIAVHDNGIGIAKENQECVFNIFRSLHAKEQYEGVGSGLAICRRITERHSGRIWVDSNESGGCTFYFSIPTLSN